MPNYDIVDWVYDHVDDDDFKSSDILKTKIKRLDTKNVLDPWLSGNWARDINTKGRDTSLNSYITEKNDDYTKEIQSEIDKANTVFELDRIDIDEDYIEGTVTKLNEAMTEKRVELVAPITVEIEGEEFEIPAMFQPGRPKAMVSAEVRDRAGGILEDIISAGEANDVPALESIDTSNLPKSIRTFLEKERSETIDAVREEVGEES